MAAISSELENRRGVEREKSGLRYRYVAEEKNLTNVQEDLVATFMAWAEAQLILHVKMWSVRRMRRPRQKNEVTYASGTKRNTYWFAAMQPILAP